MAIVRKPAVTFCIVESPYAPFTPDDGTASAKERRAVELARNEMYVNACMADAFERGEVPFASHAIYTRCNNGVKVLDDTIPAERKKGMEAGFDVAAALACLARAVDTCNPIVKELSPFADVRFVRGCYVDRTWTSGMADAMYQAGKGDQRIEKRTLNKSGPVGFWSREADADYAIDSQGRLYRWRQPAENVEGNPNTPGDAMTNPNPKTTG